MTRRDGAVFIGLGLLLVLLSLFTNAATSDAARDLRPSSYHTSPGGVGALFLLLEELGIPVERRLVPLADAEYPDGALAILSVSEEPTPAEVRELMDWLRSGGTLLYAARSGDQKGDTLGLELVSLTPPDLSARAARSWTGEVARPLGHALTVGLSPARGYRWAFAELPDAAVQPLFETGDGKTVALRVSVERGQVFAFSDITPLANQSIEQSGAAALFARAAAGSPHPVWFDEYHHGFREGGSTVSATLAFLRETRPGNAALQLSLAAIGLLVLAGTRFGAPLPPPPPERRNPLEHVDALAQAYRRASARATAGRLLLNGLVRRMGRPQAGQDIRMVVESIRRTGSSDGREAATALESEMGRGEATDLVLLSRQIDRILDDTRKGR